MCYVVLSIYSEGGMEQYGGVSGHFLTLCHEDLAITIYDIALSMYHILRNTKHLAFATHHVPLRVSMYRAAHTARFIPLRVYVLNIPCRV